MASYFELPPATVASTEELPLEQRKQLGRMSLMSPAVTQLLEDLNDEESDTSSEGGSLEADNLDDNINEPFGPSRDNQDDPDLNTTQNSFSLSHRYSLNPNLDRSSEPNPAWTAPGVSTRQKPSRMARFHSLRSILLQANIEEKIKTGAKGNMQQEEVATDRLKTQHDNRQMNEAREPTFDNEGKNKMVNRVMNKIRRRKSKSVPTMSKIGEHGTNSKLNNFASTASADNESGHIDSFNRDEEDQNIDRSDMMEIERWGRGNSAGTRRAKLNFDSGNKSPGVSDVDDLGQRASQILTSKTDQVEIGGHTGYSDASTESDTELLDKSSDEEEDAEDLIRWISHRHGPLAGPVDRNTRKFEPEYNLNLPDVSHVPELGRWSKGCDGTGSVPSQEQSRGRTRGREP